MKFLIDMNLTPHWVGFFVDQGFEAVHWSDVGPGDASDGMLMDWAAGHGFVVVTSDLDFGAILAASRQRYPSVVQIRSDLLTPEAIGAPVLAAIRQAESDLEGGALLSVDPSRGRLRILPILG